MAAVAELVDGRGLTAANAFLEHVLETPRAVRRLRVFVLLAPGERRRPGALESRGDRGPLLLRGLRGDLELHDEETKAAGEPGRCELTWVAAFSLLRVFSRSDSPQARLQPPSGRPRRGPR